MVSLYDSNGPINPQKILPFARKNLIALFNKDFQVFCHESESAIEINHRVVATQCLCMPQVQIRGFMPLAIDALLKTGKDICPGDPPLEIVKFMISAWVENMSGIFSHCVSLIKDFNPKELTLITSPTVFNYSGKSLYRLAKNGLHHISFEDGTCTTNLYMKIEPYDATTSA